MKSLGTMSNQSGRFDLEDADTKEEEAGFLKLKKYGRDKRVAWSFGPLFFGRSPKKSP
jgi:hypothetical protein